MRIVSFDELMQAVDIMTANPYLAGRDDAPEDMEYNGHIISFRSTSQFHHAVITRPGERSGCLVQYDDNYPSRIHAGGKVYTPREYFTAYVSGAFPVRKPDPNVYGYVNGKPVYSHDEFAITARKFGPIESDDALIAYAEKETGHWHCAGWNRTFTTYYLSTSDNLHSHLTYAEWDRLKELQQAARAAEKAADDARQWRKIETMYWADNSIEEIWEDKDGNRKTVTIDGPHGDACY